MAAEVDNAWAHAAFGWVCTIRRDNDNALRACFKALELNPNLAFAEGSLAVSYAHRGDAENAIIHADKADRLSPRDVARGLWTLARSWAALIEGDYASGIGWAKWISETNPEFPAPQRWGRAGGHAA